MNERIGRIGSTLLAALVALGLSACGDTTGPEGMGTATVQMDRSGGSSSSLALSTVAADARFARVDLDSVAAIHVDVDSVEVHRIGDGEDGEGDGEGPTAGWYGVAVTEAALDLLALPVDETLTIASGSVPAGAYNQLRLFISGATVDFAEGYDPDGEGGIEAGATGVPLVIPSSDQTGIKVPGLSFDVPADAESEVTVSFDEGASVQNLTVTGTGEVRMTPVLTPAGGPPAGT